MIDSSWRCYDATRGPQRLLRANALWSPAAAPPSEPSSVFHAVLSRSWGGQCKILQRFTPRAPFANPPVALDERPHNGQIGHASEKVTPLGWLPPNFMCGACRGDRQWEL